MMRKIKNIRLLLLAIWLVVLSYTLSGCRQEEEVVFFAEEANSWQVKGQEADSVASEGISAEDSASEPRSGADASTGAETPGRIMVYICGAVKEPGVVELPEGSRMNDAIQAAGGFTEDASVTSVNLAARLEDEEMIYVLTEEEVKVQETASETQRSAAENILININTADIYRLCSLPGIGESKARDIVTYREEHGSFQKKEDIMRVTGIKENLYRKISDLISVK